MHVAQPASRARPENILLPPACLAALLCANLQASLQLFHERAEG